MNGVYMVRADLQNIKLISFDIFDTILLRTVAKPIDVYAIVWEKANENNLSKTDIAPEEFVKLRVEMEHRARNKCVNRECNLEDIYREFPNYITGDIDGLKTLEIECEKSCSYLNWDMYEFIKQVKSNDIRVVLTSDMYLNNTQMKDILESIGFDIQLLDAIFISNEHYCSKQNGELFDVLLKHFPEVKAEEILHVGDNKNADYDQPIQKGLQAIHYRAIPDRLHSIYDYEKIRHNIPQKEILSLRKITVYNKDKEGYTEVEKTAYEIGAGIFGPFMTAYISHVCDRLEKLGISRIYPLMREGYILGKMLENEAASRGMQLLIKPIYISRKVTYIPAIENVNREEIENMIGARNLTVGEAIELVGLTKDDVEIDEKYLTVRWKETHTISYMQRTLKEYLILQFLQKENVAKIEQYVKEQRLLLTDYLKQEIGDMQGVATIDIGFFGRIQMWMEKALVLERIPKKFKHFLGIGITGDKLYQGFDFEGYYSTIAQNQDMVPTIHRTTDIIEKFISVTEGSTIGYRRVDGIIEPIKAEKVENDLIINKSFEGIMDFQKNFLKFRRSKPQIAQKVVNNRREMLMIVHRLIDMPRLVEVNLIAGIEADTNFGTNYKKEIITWENRELLKTRGIEFVDKCNASYTYKNSNIVWPKGLVTLGDEFYYVRRAMKNSTQNDILRSMQEVVERVQQEGLSKIALYGAGENGRQFYFICQLYNIQVTCFIDRKESIWGTRKEGIEVMGLREAMRRGNMDFIITSLFSISEIREYILELFGKEGKQANIFSV